MKTLKTVACLIVVLIAAPAAFAQFPEADFGDTTIPITVSADMLSYDRENKIYTAEGNVEITRGAMVLKADRVTMNGVTKEAEATGNAYFFNGTDEIKADRFALNIDTQTGVIYKGMIFYADKHFYISGDELEKLGEKTYRIRGGSLTSCDGPVPAWKITGKRSEVTLEGYGKIWNGAFWIKNFPVMYIPFGMYPARTKRASGFLFPAFGEGDNKGFRFKAAYFWAINRSMDATFTADIMTERGVMGGLEYRYFLKDDLKGEMSYTFIDDAGYTDHDGIKSEEGFRWGLDVYHRQTLPGDIKALVDVNLVSDDSYLEDFADNVNMRTAPYLESRASLLKEWYPASMILDASWFENLSDSDNSDRSTLQRLGRFTTYVRPVSLFGTPVAFEMDGSVTNFHRDEGLRALRLNVAPRLTANIAPGYFSITPWVEGDFSWWWIDGDNSYPDQMDRATYTAGVEFSTYLARTYTRNSGAYSSVTHIIKPVVGYRYSPPMDEESYPNFDDKDRIRSTSLLYVSLINRILARRASDKGKGVSDELLYAEIGAGIDFAPDLPWLGYSVDDPHTISYFELRFSPSSHVSIRGKGRYDHNVDRLLYLSSDMLFTDARGDVLSLGYVVESDVIYPEQYDHLYGSMKLVVNKSIDLTFGGRYSFDEGDFRYLSGSIDYHRQCWGVDFTVYNNRHPNSNDPDELGFYVSITLSGLGTLPRIDLGQTTY
jgi:LPS-assembly protein